MVALRLVPADDRPLPPEVADDDLVMALPAGVEVDSEGSAALESAAGGLEADAWFADVMVDRRRVRRPAWSPTRILGEAGACNPLAVRAGWLRTHGRRPADPALPLHLVEARATVAHLPVVLTVHTTAPSGPSIADLDAHLRRSGVPATVRAAGDHLELVADPSFAPPVSVVVPSAGATVEIEGRTEVAIERLLASLGDVPDRIEILVVVGDEYRGDPRRLATHPAATVTVLRRPPGRFNFSTAVDFGVLHARHDLVLMLNDDIEADGAGFVDSMALHLTDPSVAGVGAQLLYPDGTIQHSGVVIDDARPLHPFVGWPPRDAAEHGAGVARDVIAVTGACLMVRRAQFLAVGGLSPGFPLSFNDVDLCIRLRRAVGRVVIEPTATLLHHETLTREPDITADEWNRWISRWGEIVDPWYHPGYHRPDDPHHLHRNADHLDPPIGTAPGLAEPRTATLRSRVHRGRTPPLRPIVTP